SEKAGPVIGQVYRDNIRLAVHLAGQPCQTSPRENLTAFLKRHFLDYHRNLMTLEDKAFRVTAMITALAYRFSRGDRMFRTGQVDTRITHSTTDPSTNCSHPVRRFYDQKRGSDVAHALRIRFANAKPNQQE